MKKDIDKKEIITIKSLLKESGAKGNILHGSLFLGAIYIFVTACIYGYFNSENVNKTNTICTFVFLSIIILAFGLIVIKKFILPGIKTIRVIKHNLIVEIDTIIEKKKSTTRDADGTMFYEHTIVLKHNKADVSQKVWQSLKRNDKCYVFNAGDATIIKPVKKFELADELKSKVSSQHKNTEVNHFGPM